MASRKLAMAAPVIAASSDPAMAAHVVQMAGFATSHGVALAPLWQRSLLRAVLKQRCEQRRRAASDGGGNAQTLALQQRSNARHEQHVCAARISSDCNPALPYNAIAPLRPPHSGLHHRKVHVKHNATTIVAYLPAASEVFSHLRLVDVLAQEITSPISGQNCPARGDQKEFPAKST